MSEDVPPLPAPDEPSASPHLIWADDGSPQSGRFGDVYFSKEDGLAETRAVFLQGCGLPDAWQERTSFTVAELGFGTGLNIMALIDLWRQHGPGEGQLNIFSVEGFPLSRDEAARALSAWPELADTAAAVLADWPSGVPGFHRIDLPQWRVCLDLAIGDVNWALDQWCGQADAWFLDGFSPALNPGMWSPEVMALIRARSAAGARVATFTVAGLVRRGLADQGFVVEKKPGFGRKRERLEAYLPGPAPAPTRPEAIAVVGGGIAGASIARALAARGARVTLIEAHQPGHGGSGFPAALVTPRLDAGDAVIADVHAQALRRSGQLYAGVEGAILAPSVLQLEQAERDAARYDKIAAQPLWSRDQMKRVPAAEAAGLLGEASTPSGLMMEGAMALHPAAVLEAWLAGVERLSAQVGRLERDGDQWRISDAAGCPLLTADAVIVTAGWGTAALCPDLPLNPVAGQADWVEGPTSRPVAWGGYAVPTGKGLLYGATHERGATDSLPSDAASDVNLATLAKALPALADQVQQAPPSARRKAVRATTPDRLPISGPIPGAPGLYVLGGLGSRGFCVAPLLGEDIASRILGHPAPLPRASRERLSPARFTRT